MMLAKFAKQRVAGDSNNALGLSTAGAGLGARASSRIRLAKQKS
jgi:hypothetical protein